MNELADLCKQRNRRFQPKKTSLTKPVKTWSEKDLLDGNIIDAFVIILRTSGCSWLKRSGCSMCGYFTDSAWTEVSDESLLLQVEQALQHYKNQPVIKIFNSGSFLDDAEISSSAQRKIIERLSIYPLKKISVESRPRFITKEKLTFLQESFPMGLLEIGVGLETSSDLIRTQAINKGFTFASYEKAAQIIHDQHMKLKTYVLIKPPFLTEQEAILDGIRTIHDIATLTDVISLNPTNIQRFTLVEYLWNRGQYRPPWLWSIKEILTYGLTTYPKIRYQCDIVGGGKPRGAHNCPHCNRDILTEIRNISLSQNLNDFKEIECSCKDLWHDQCTLEPLSFGSMPDIQRCEPL
jgi:radical SAM enzyme (TIGR01210 family)